MKKTTEKFARISVKDTKGFKKGIPLNQIKYWSESSLDGRPITVIYLAGDGWRIDADMPIDEFDKLFDGVSK